MKRGPLVGSRKYKEQPRMQWASKRRDGQREREASAREAHRKEENDTSDA
jgi:hypothetical protein